MGRGAPDNNGLLSPARSSFGEEREIIQHVFRKFVDRVPAHFWVLFLLRSAPAV
jgi:hypothetical protein